MKLGGRARSTCGVMRIVVATVLMAVAIGAAPASAQSPAPPALTVPRLSTAPAIDGTLGAEWTTAASVNLATDFTYRRPAEEPTTVRIAEDAGGLDIAFLAVQHEAVTAAQTTNAAGVQSDDYVGVYLWPQGTNGFSYGFFANPRGTRYQTSSENSAYTPQWSAVGRATAGGYVVTMHIPFGIIRNGGSTRWRGQLVRNVVASGLIDVWAFSSNQSNPNDPAFAGIWSDVGPPQVVRSPARAQVYALGELTTPAYGGNTSRVGADVSLPVTPTASLVASFHPDFSNVDTDQQTIAPQAFAYQYTEVRPFFTQAAQAFNHNLASFNSPQFLYTPAIPTFRDGYALEGTQGPFTFSGFDALSNGRTDQGQAFDYSAETTRASYTANLQHIAVDTTSGLHDVLDTITTGYQDQQLHLGVYANAAAEHGSLVASPR